MSTRNEDVLQERRDGETTAEYAVRMTKEQGAAEVRSRIASSLLRGTALNEPQCCDQCSTRWLTTRDLAYEIARGLHG